MFFYITWHLFFYITLHCDFSWSGLKDGHLNATQVVESMANNCRDRIRSTDVLIIDEISMISQKVFEQVTCFYPHVYLCVSWYCHAAQNWWFQLIFYVISTIVYDKQCRMYINVLFLNCALIMLGVNLIDLYILLPYLNC